MLLPVAYLLKRVNSYSRFTQAAYPARPRRAALRLAKPLTQVQSR